MNMNSNVALVLALAIAISPATTANGQRTQITYATVASPSVSIDSIVYTKGLRFDHVNRLWRSVAGSALVLGPLFIVVRLITLPFILIAGAIDVVSSPFRRTTKALGRVDGVLLKDGQPLRNESVWIGVPNPDIADDQNWMIQQPYTAKSNDEGRFSLEFDLRFASRNEKKMELRSKGYPVHELFFRLEGESIYFTEAEAYESPSSSNAGKLVWPK